MTSLERVAYDAEIERLRATLDEDAFESAWAAGRSMTTDEAVAFALAG